MADGRRGWLALQRDLGGDEVILDAPLDLAAASVTEPINTSSGEPAVLQESAPPAPSTPREPESTSSASGEPDDSAGWRKGMPPIPGPGLSVRLPALTAESVWTSLEEIAAAVVVCPKCPLCRTRTHAVPGEGNPRAGLMVVGEGPGESEDLSGRPFVGRAGELLDKILAGVELARADVFIANVVKCRPPRNRVPLPDEREACMPYLRRQIELVRPRVILALGGTAAEALLGVKESLGRLRLKVHDWNGTPLVVTYHPAALLRNPNWKRPAWDDVRIARQLLDRDA
ncbi:MAG TPA: uracil-DNA glycosylase [Gemmatimonadales bacterium]